MKNRFNRYLAYYLISLFFFSIIYLIKKHEIGNDSTISEWLINYSGGFTKRGIIGQTSIFFSNLLDQNLRDVILFQQILLIGFYFLLIFNFFKDLKTNRIIILSIFTPIFILYPIAEIEVLARKEVFIFCIFIIYLFLKKKFLQDIYKIIFLPVAILIWEPVIFYLIFFFASDILRNNFEKIDKKFLLNLIYYSPALFVALYIVVNPISSENHEIMANYLKNNFNENCYMSCALLKSKSTVYSQFQGNFGKYSFEVFFRYFLIILIGFGPLMILAKNSKFINNTLFYFKNFGNLLTPIAIMLAPVILLFAMGYDWGRWVNISYVFSVIFYFYLYKNKLILLDEEFLNNKRFKFLKNKKAYIILIIIFCFGWNPKTVITGDVASKPGYQIPRKALKIIYYDYIKQ